MLWHPQDFSTHFKFMIRQRKRKTTNSPSLLLNLHNFIKGQSVCLYLIFSFVCGSKLKMWKIRVRGIMKIWKKCVDEWVFQATLAVTGIRFRNMREWKFIQYSYSNEYPSFFWFWFCTYTFRSIKWIMRCLGVGWKRMSLWIPISFVCIEDATARARIDQSIILIHRYLNDIFIFKHMYC